jgi:hypothetical protein
MAITKIGNIMGPEGLEGNSAYTYTSADFTVPDIGQTADITVEDSTWIAEGQMVYLEDGKGPGESLALKVTVKNGNIVTLLNPTVTEAGTNTNLNYTLNEQDTGITWIDGKKVYQKTVDFGALPDGTQTNKAKSVAHGIVNLGLVLEFHIATIATIGDNTYRIGSTYVESDPLQVIAGYVDDTNIVISTGIDRTMFNAYVTLRYICTDR